MIQDRIITCLRIQEDINQEVIRLLTSLQNQQKELEEKINELYSRRTKNKQ